MSSRRAQLASVRRRAFSLRRRQGRGIGSAAEMFTIEYVEGVAEDLERLTAYRRKAILDAIETHLQHEPKVETRRRRELRGLVPPWEHVPPVWQLRVDEYRVFYDVDEAKEIVKIRAVRHKLPHKTTEEIL